MDRDKLIKWCSIPASQLENHPDSKVRLEIHEKSAVSRIAGQMMADEVIANNTAHKPTKWVLPCGPMEQYKYFIERVNNERISLKDVYVFHMDEFLDWQGRPFPLINNYFSMTANMLHDFYGRIDSELNVPEDQRIWPDINNIDYLDRRVEELGGIDTVYAGVGYRGLVAFCEAPNSPCLNITVEEYAQSKTRIVHLNEDTLIALSERDIGGLIQVVPPMAVTIGFKAMLTAKKAVCMVTTGNWKQTAVRVLMFSEPTVEYPVTLLPRYIPEVVVLVDPGTAAAPIGEGIFAEVK